MNENPPCRCITVILTIKSKNQQNPYSYSNVYTKSYYSAINRSHCVWLYGVWLNCNKLPYIKTQNDSSPAFEGGWAKQKQNDWELSFSL